MQSAKRAKERRRIESRVASLKISKTAKANELARRLAQHDLTAKAPPALRSRSRSASVASRSSSRKIVIRTPSKTPIRQTRSLRGSTRIPSMGISLNALKAVMTSIAGVGLRHLPLQSPVGQPEIQQISAGQDGKLTVSVPAGHKLWVVFNPLTQTGYWHMGPDTETIATYPYTDIGCCLQDWMNYTSGINIATGAVTSTGRYCYANYYDFNPSEFKTWDGVNASSIISWRKINTVGKMCDPISTSPFPPYYNTTVVASNTGMANWQASDSSYTSQASQYVAQYQGGAAFIDIAASNSLQGYEFTNVTLSQNVPQAYSYSAQRWRNNGGDYNDSVVFLEQPFLNSEVNSLRYTKDLKQTLFDYFAPVVCNGAQRMSSVLQLPSVHGQTTFNMGAVGSQEVPKSTIAPPAYNQNASIDFAINSYYETDLSSYVIMGNSGDTNNGAVGTGSSYPVFCHLGPGVKSMRLGDQVTYASTTGTQSVKMAFTANAPTTTQQPNFMPRIPPNVHNGALFSVAGFFETAVAFTCIYNPSSTTTPGAPLFVVIDTHCLFAIGPDPKSALWGACLPSIKPTLVDCSSAAGHCHSAPTRTQAWMGCLAKSLSQMRLTQADAKAAAPLVQESLLNAENTRNQTSGLRSTIPIKGVEDPDKKLDPSFLDRVTRVASRIFSNPAVQEVGALAGRKALSLLMDKFNPVNAIEDITENPMTLIEDIPFDV